MKPASVLIAGVDEAGRGPLAGVVVAAAVILDPHRPIQGLDDSKRLSASRRDQLDQTIRAQAVAWAVAQAEVAEIDRINILQASLLAMQRAVLALAIAPERVLIDGNRCPSLPYPSQAIVGGDRSQASISAASIIAKVSRDKQMLELDRRYPDYGFAQHKGYPTRAHLAALRRYGATPVHRRSFRPVREVCEGKLSTTP